MINIKKIGFVLLQTMVIVAVAYYLFLDLQEKKFQKSLETAKKEISQGLFFTTDGSLTIVDGKPHHFHRDHGANGDNAEAIPRALIHEHRVYLPVSKVAEMIGADLIIEETMGLYTLKHRGFTSHFIKDINLLIVNDEPIVMPEKPLIREEDVYIPANFLAKALNVPLSHSYELGIVVINPKRDITHSTYSVLAKGLGLEAKYDLNPEIRALNIKDFPLYSYARMGNLYVSDAEGKLHRWLLLDDNQLSKEALVLSESYPPNSVFFADGTEIEEKLYDIKTNKLIGPAPRALISQDIDYLMWVYVHEKQRSSYSDWDEAGLKRIISGEFDDKTFIEQRRKAQETGNYSRRNKIQLSKKETEAFKEGWRKLVQGLEKGDILVFRNANSDNRYGYFNHAALVVDVDKEEASAQLLEARSQELGVGYQAPSDRLSERSFEEDNYWKNYDIIVHCRVKLDENTEIDWDEFAKKSCDYFESYSFGYGSYWGKKETTCVELINTAYGEYGFEIINTQAYVQKLKEVLDGNFVSIVMLPDDLILSDRIIVKEILAR